MNPARKLAIGTAQWGLDYGATNESGRLDNSVVLELLHLMRENQISHLDTAASYGDSETRIGNLDTTGIDIQTKLSAKGSTRDSLILRLHESLVRLKADSVDSLLIHDWFALDQDEVESVSQFFVFCMEKGLTQHVGVSAYELSDLERATQELAIWDTAQIPINVMDQRFINASEAFPNIAFQARSIFLQGLLLAPYSQHADLIKFHNFCEANGVSPLALCLQFIGQQDWLDSVIIAPTTVGEFNEIIGGFAAQEEDVDWNEFASADMKLLDPRTWN